MLYENSLIPTCSSSNASLTVNLTFYNKFTIFGIMLSSAATLLEMRKLANVIDDIYELQ